MNTGAGGQGGVRIGSIVCFSQWVKCSSEMMGWCYIHLCKGTIRIRLSYRAYCSRPFRYAN